MRAWSGAELFNFMGGHGSGDFDEVCSWDCLECRRRMRYACSSNREIHKEYNDALGSVQSGGMSMEKEQHGSEQSNAQMSDEEDAIRVFPHTAYRSTDQTVKAKHGHNSAEDDGREETLEPDAGQDEEDVVQDDVTDYEGVYDAAEDAVIAVDALMRRVESVGVRVERFEGEEVLDGEL